MKLQMSFRTGKYFWKEW